ncbi:MAG: substrate-binding domain-containing protein, partial [Thermodesulfobacteriota bacterium]|nr:substrate-binding domain-containing protein [Thermodesulfobacteriota bacterium]
CFEDVVAPIAAWLEHKVLQERKNVLVTLARKTPSKLGLEEVVRLAVGRVGDRYVAAPLARGSGMITTLTKAQAVTRIPPHSEGVERDEVVSAELLVPKNVLNKVLIHVGSHDNTLDLIANELMGLPDPLRLVSSHVGSMGGLTALSSGLALFAGAHLFDPETNDFNFPFIDKYLPEVNLTAVNLVIRHQGLMVRKGNPLGIDGIEDLGRGDISFINRQRGAGTRILLDHHLGQAGLDAKKVKGYEREEYTHMAVAVNVLTGSADCGLGIFAAAKALDLDFVPVARERYDLLIPVKNADDPKMRVLLDLINGKEFKEKAAGLGGYETGLTGQIMKPGLGLG